MPPELQITDDSHVRTIRLNRPQKKNALSHTLAWDLVGSIDEAAADDDVWVLAITGTDDAFCSGIDLTPERNATDQGNTAEIYAYSPFGESDDASPLGNPYRFTARRLDAATGLYYYRARMYDAALGRFLQPDPAGRWCESP